MTCSTCGKPILPGSKFCPGCGATLVAHAVPPRKKSGLGIFFILAVIALIAMAIWSDHLPKSSAVASTTATTVTKSASSLPPYMIGAEIGSPTVPADFTRDQLKAIVAFAHGKMDGPRRFQQHCGKANYSYIRNGGYGAWDGATTLLYSSNQAGQNPSGTKNDISVLIEPSRDLPSWVATIYVPGFENIGPGVYATKAYLSRDDSDQSTHDENGSLPGRVIINIDRVIALLGCHA